MKSYRIALRYFLIDTATFAVLFTISTLIHDRDRPDLLETPGSWFPVSLGAIFASLAVSLIGWLIAFLKNALDLFPGEKVRIRYYVVCQRGASVFFFLLAVWILWALGGFDKNNIRAASNQNFVDNVLNERPPGSVYNYFNSFLIRGYAAFVKRFSDPNDFELRAFYFRSQDTLVRGRKDTAFFFYFEYQMDDDSVWYSRVHVVDTLAYVDVQKGDPKLDTFCARTDSIRDEDFEDLKKELKKFKKALPDSTRTEIFNKPR